MTRIECSNCGNVKELTAKVIVLPYTCTECEEAAEFQEAIQPASFTPYDGTGPTCADPAGLNEDDATVENTTLLIADLEQQLAEAKEFEEARTEYIVGLESTQVQANQIIADLTDQFNIRQDRLKEASARIAALTQESSDRYKSAYEANALNQRLQQDLSDIMSRLKTVREERDALAKQNVELGVRSFAQSGARSSLGRCSTSLASGMPRKRNSKGISLCWRTSWRLRRSGTSKGRRNTTRCSGPTKTSRPWVLARLFNR